MEAYYFLSGALSWNIVLNAAQIEAGVAAERSQAMKEESARQGEYLEVEDSLRREISKEREISRVSHHFQAF